MGVLELIQQKAFLGKEFLTWLWFRSEQDGQLKPSRGEAVKIEILGPMTLDAAYGDARATTLKGDSPATAPEAGTALVEGKKVLKTKLKFERGSTEWLCTLEGETFNVSGLAVPAPGRMPFDEAIGLRMEMISEFEVVLGELFDMFLELRLDEKLWAKEIEVIQAWVKEK